jgi:murein DD-endopeptidase MepM/ murein hydrolase activator NlpD
MLVHLKQGSDRVKQGEVIAAVGVSGSAEEPHLHYELRAGPGLNVEGLPSYFTQFCRLLGSRTIAVNPGRIDTGDIVIAQPH